MISLKKVAKLKRSKIEIKNQSLVSLKELFIYNRVSLKTINYLIIEFIEENNQIIFVSLFIKILSYKYNLNKQLENEWNNSEVSNEILPVRN